MRAFPSFLSHVIWAGMTGFPGKPIPPHYAAPLPPRRTPAEKTAEMRRAQRKLQPFFGAYTSWAPERTRQLTCKCIASRLWEGCYSLFAFSGEGNPARPPLRHAERFFPALGIQYLPRVPLWRFFNREAVEAFFLLAFSF